MNQTKLPENQTKAVKIVHCEKKSADSGCCTKSKQICDGKCMADPGVGEIVPKY